MNEIYNHKQSHFVYPVGKPIIPHLRRYQGFAVVHYSVTLDALYLGHPRLSLNWGNSILLIPLAPKKSGKMLAFNQ